VLHDPMNEQNDSGTRQEIWVVRYAVPTSVSGLGVGGNEGEGRRATRERDGEPDPCPVGKIRLHTTEF